MQLKQLWAINRRVPLASAIQTIGCGRRLDGESLQVYWDVHPTSPWSQLEATDDALLGQSYQRSWVLVVAGSEFQTQKRNQISLERIHNQTTTLDFSCSYRWQSPLLCKSELFTRDWCWQSSIRSRSSQWLQVKTFWEAERGVFGRNQSSNTDLAQNSLFITQHREVNHRNDRRGTSTDLRRYKTDSRRKIQESISSSFATHKDRTAVFRVFTEPWSSQKWQLYVY